MDIVYNKEYFRYNLTEDISHIFDGYLNIEDESYEIDSDILLRLSKILGFSYQLYSTLYKISPEAAYALVSSMSIQSEHPEIFFLVNTEEHKVLNFSLDKERAPLLNSEFIKRVKSQVEASDILDISEIQYHPDDLLCRIILKKKEPLLIEEKYENKPTKTISYEIGVLLINDESDSISSRLVLYIDRQPFYLPASYYSTSTSRYKKSTSSTADALDVIVLKIIDEFRDNLLYSKLYDLHFRYRSNKVTFATYEEYNSILRTLRKIPSIIEDTDSLSIISSEYENYEKIYPQLEDQKSSYIWRCTAVGDITIGYLISLTTTLINNISAPPVEYNDIRELLGTYISTERIVEEIAKESI